MAASPQFELIAHQEKLRGLYNLHFREFTNLVKDESPQTMKYPTISEDPGSTLIQGVADSSRNINIVLATDALSTGVTISNNIDHNKTPDPHVCEVIYADLKGRDQNGVEGPFCMVLVKDWKNSERNEMSYFAILVVASRNHHEAGKVLIKDLNTSNWKDVVGNVDEALDNSTNPGLWSTLTKRENLIQWSKETRRDEAEDVLTRAMAGENLGNKIVQGATVAVLPDHTTIRNGSIVLNNMAKHLLMGAKITSKPGNWIEQ